MRVLLKSSSASWPIESNVIWALWYLLDWTRIKLVSNIKCRRRKEGAIHNNHWNRLSLNLKRSKLNQKQARKENWKKIRKEMAQYPLKQKTKRISLLQDLRKYTLRLTFRFKNLPWMILLILLNWTYRQKWQNLKMKWLILHQGNSIFKNPNKLVMSWASLFQQREEEDDRLSMKEQICHTPLLTPKNRENKDNHHQTRSE